MRMRMNVARPVTVHVAGVGLIGAIAFAGYIGCVGPARAAQSRNTALRASLAGASEQESSLRRRQREIEGKLRDARGQVTTRGVTLRAPDQLNGQVERVSSLAAEAGVIVDALSSAAPIEDAKFRRIPLRMSGRATSRNLAEFMRAVRQRLPDVTVRTFDIHADVSNTGEGATVQMELDWYASKSDK